nr:hypothetical protein [Tanacetum cinerariifolium]
MSYVEVVDSIDVGDIRPEVYAVEGQVHVMVSQMVQAVSRLEQVDTRMEQDHIMDEPLSLDLVFDFSMDEPKPQHAYDLFTPGPLPSYVGNPNNINGWINADLPLLGELGEMGEPLGAEVDEPLVDSVNDELAEPIVEVEEQMVAQVMDIEDNLVMLFGVEDDSSDDEFDGPEGNEEVWEMHEKWLLAPATPPSMPVMPSTEYLRVIEDLCTPMGNLEYGHGLLVKKVMMMSYVEVVDSIDVGDICPEVYAVEGQVHVMVSQMVQAAAVQHKDVHIQQLQTLVAEMSSREGTLMQCILGLDRRLADVEGRSLGP